MNAPESLRAQVLDRYISVHAFCVAHPELKRSTVYMVLAGRYPGRTEKQAARIRAALAGPPERVAATPAPGLTRDETTEALQNIRCNHCRRLDRRGCFECRTQTEREARELYAKLFPGR